MELHAERIPTMNKTRNGKQFFENLEPLEVSTIEQMVVFLDLLNTFNKRIVKEECVKVRFNKMVKWFNKYVIKKNDFWVPVMEGCEVDLYYLYMAVKLNGGKRNVTKNGFWSLIASDMKLDPRKGFQLMLQYDEHLQQMDVYHANVRRRQLEDSQFNIKEGMSNNIRESQQQNELAIKKRKVPAIRDWPPGCGPATKKK
ncbi:hypothetical protein E3N88_24240 [Mikania micrantha]|uniref:ARID domain-containing protein n=1 Tax=Mikania micrantha TaxID=192012 RepID=A0A5N6NGP4_9ASTR|nr:hypothetical protein E3N88_24240 [Mikania micrantha]